MKICTRSFLLSIIVSVGCFNITATLAAPQNPQPGNKSDTNITPAKTQSSNKLPPAKSRQNNKTKGKQVGNKKADGKTTQGKPAKLSIVHESIKQLEELVKLGMPSLALRFVDEEQKKWPKYSNDWYVYEYKRVEYLAAAEQWQKLVERVQPLLKNAKPGKQIIPQHAQWFATQLAIAQLQTSRPDDALKTLRGLLWLGSNKRIQPNIMALWRRLIVRSYVDSKKYIDAQKALIKYKKDYKKSSEEWDLLQARVLLKTNRAKEVPVLLKYSKSINAQVISMIAQVRTQPKKINDITREVRERLTDKKLSKAEYWAYRYILLDAANQKRDTYRKLQMTERLLSVGGFHGVIGEEFKVGGEELWKLYEAVGRNAGNRFQLLVGDDKAWFDKAESIKLFTPIQARCLFAMLALNASDKTLRQKAHKELVTMLSKQTNGLEIVNQLYLVSNRIAVGESLPEEVRFRLVDYSLITGEISFAARLMAAIKEPPKDEYPFDWRIRKARVLILEGQYKIGAEVLKRAITELKDIAGDQLDRLLQVLFDLQAVDQHQLALDLFNTINIAWLTETHLRELYYWKAESRYALKQYDHAARLYLKSARTVDSTMNDLWAHSARFKAAGSLVKARLYDDALTMFKALLLVTRGEARKTLLKQEIQHIQLLKNSKKHV